MKKGRYFFPAVIICLAILFSCNDQPGKAVSEKIGTQYAKGSYGADVNFLQEHLKDLLELRDEPGGGRILLSAGYQGRVMTSSAYGDTGNSYGWINYSLIESGKPKKQFNPVGGEERFWIGPEGGQYSFYFRKGDSMNIAHWQVPGIIDTIPFELVESDKSSATFHKTASLSNYSGTPFQFDITRRIRLLNRSSLPENIKSSLPDSVHFVAYETDNQVKNAGQHDWKKESGLLSIWLLGMLIPSPETVVIIPFHPRADSRQYITDSYFGSIPPERLIVRDSVLYFTCDGKYRSKIGLSPVIAKPMAASFDFKKNILSVIYFNIDQNGLYVNSKWEIQKHPYKGDVLNAYNDGPLADGSQLGPFYELESSSSAKELKKGETQSYKQVTCHFEGNYSSMQELATKLLGIQLEDAKIK